MVQNFLIKLKYPRISFYKSTEQKYTDLISVVMRLSSNSLQNNTTKHIFEFDCGDSLEYGSVINEFSGIKNCNFYFFNTVNQTMTYYGCERNVITDFQVLSEDNNKHDLKNGLGAFGKVITYANVSEESVLQFIANQQLSVSLLTFSLNDSSIDLIKHIVSKTEVYFVVIKNNSTGFLSLGNSQLRNYFLGLGYVYHSRIDKKHDIFVLSDFVNGFPSASFRQLNTLKLQKYISEPPGSDYTKPR